MEPVVLEPVLSDSVGDSQVCCDSSSMILEKTEGIEARGEAKASRSFART